MTSSAMTGLGLEYLCNSPFCPTHYLVLGFFLLESSFSVHSSLGQVNRFLFVRTLGMLFNF